LDKVISDAPVFMGPTSTYGGVSEALLSIYGSPFNDVAQADWRLPPHQRTVRVGVGTIWSASEYLWVPLQRRRTSMQIGGFSTTYYWWTSWHAELCNNYSYCTTSVNSTYVLHAKWASVFMGSWALVFIWVPHQRDTKRRFKNVTHLKNCDGLAQRTRTTSWYASTQRM
jgi:hypothetical protein